MFKAIYFSVTVAAVLIGGGCKSRADRIEDRVMDRFPVIDANHDGRISREEFAASRFGQRAKDPMAAFDRMDADHDGFVTEAEMRSALEARAK